MPIRNREASNTAFAERLIAMLAAAGRPRRGAGAYLARRYKVATVTANAWLNGTHKMATDLARKVAEDHGATFDELYFGVTAGSGSMEAGPAATTGSNTQAVYGTLARVPVVSWVSAGAFCDANDPWPPGVADDWVVTTDRVGKRAFALRVRGDSMTNPAGFPSFPDGLTIIVDPDREARHGSFVIAKEDPAGEATFKQLKHDGNEVFLVPLNPRYDPVRVKDPDSLHICGVIVAGTFSLP